MKRDLYFDSELGNGRLFTICEVLEEAQELMLEKKLVAASKALHVAQEMAQRMENRLRYYRDKSYV